MDVQGGCSGIAFWREARWYSNWALCARWICEIGAIVKLYRRLHIGLPGLYKFNFVWIKFRFLVSHHADLSPFSWKSNVWWQEYPPGITLVPMKSSTLRPFRTTNLVVIQATSGTCGSKRPDYFACGDALLIDPGCCSQVHTEVKAISKITFF